MDKLDSRTWIDAVHTYDYLRRLNTRLTFGFYALSIGFVAVFASAATHDRDAIAAVLFLIFMAAACILGLGIFITGFELREFRCPRCGGRFSGSWWNNRPTDHCHHCGLDLGAAARAAEKKPTGGELWE